MSWKSAVFGIDDDQSSLWRLSFHCFWIESWDHVVGLAQLLWITYVPLSVDTVLNSNLSIHFSHFLRVKQMLKYVFTCKGKCIWLTLKRRGCRQRLERKNSASESRWGDLGENSKRKSKDFSSYSSPITLGESRMRLVLSQVHRYETASAFKGLRRVESFTLTIEV